MRRPAEGSFRAVVHAVGLGAYFGRSNVAYTNTPWLMNGPDPGLRKIRHWLMKIFRLVLTFWNNQTIQQHRFLAKFIGEGGCLFIGGAERAVQAASPSDIDFGCVRIGERRPRCR